jgi:hypothetical protein
MSTRSKTSSRTRTQSTIELEPGELDFPAVEAGERFAGGGKEHFSRIRSSLPCAL